MAALTSPDSSVTISHDSSYSFTCASNLVPCSIAFRGYPSEPTITIKPDGNVELNPALTLNEASQLFLDNVSAVGLELKARIAKLETENEKLREQLNPRSSLTQINIPAITRYIPRTVGEINQAEDAEAYTRAMKGI